jgi:hypothetical protein
MFLYQSQKAEIRKICGLKERIPLCARDLQTLPGEVRGIGQVISIDLNDSLRPQNLAAQAGIACVGKALCLLQLPVRLLGLAELGMRKPTE